MKPTPIPAKSGQESVWDYPRPPRLEDTAKHIRVIFNNIVIVDTQRSKRVLETSHPPVYYIPAEDIKLNYLVETPQKSWCEWKGCCIYYDVIVGEKKAKAAAWCYVQTVSEFNALQNHYGFYAGLMDACYINDELVQPQPGNLYGGWITKDIVGPFKGEPGTMGW